MSINIMGNSGDVFVNGKRINLSDSQSGDNKKFDKKEAISADEIKVINIKSDFSFKVITDKLAKEITARIHGNGNEDSIKLSVSKNGNVAEITAYGESSGDNIIISNFGGISFCSITSRNMVRSSGSCTTIINGTNQGSLEITIPTKEYDLISAWSNNGDIDIDDLAVQSKKIYAETKNGNANLCATFEVIEVTVKNGNADVETKAKSDIRLNIDTKNGNASVTLDNIKESRVSVDSKNGRASDKPRLGGLYTATGYIKSKNGNVSLR